MTARVGAPFADRADAGRRLAQRLGNLAGPGAVVLGLPRGGVPVAAEVARALGAPLDVIVVRKLGLPGNPEVAMGAIGEGYFEVLDQGLIHRAGITAGQVRAAEARERTLLEARVRRLRHGLAPLDLTGRTAVIVDDGIATGATAHVASRVARHLGADRVVVAAPVAPAGLDIPDADDVVVIHAPVLFGAVGVYYRDFSPTSDAEVVTLLDEAARRTQLVSPEGARADGWRVAR